MKYHISYYLLLFVKSLQDFVTEYYVLFSIISRFHNYTTYLAYMLFLYITTLMFKGDNLVQNNKN